MALLIIASLGLMLVSFASGRDAWGVAAAAIGAVTLALASGIVSGADFYDRRRHRAPRSA
ncbi:hypothetical protein [Segniliparus rotundus]|nr:hypothetical protein [Segniliparus rotundus]